jgi:glycosyltransferase involved in cell wall biosynthesis
VAAATQETRLFPHGRGRALRIGVVTTSYPRHAGDPAGCFVAAHVDAMRALGHHVEVIGAHTIESSLFRGAGAPDELERGRGYLRGALFAARLAAAIARRAHAWDLVIAHWLVPALAALPVLAARPVLAALAARAALPTRDAPPAREALPSHVPILAFAHGGDVHTLRRLHLLAPALRLLRDARLVFVSDELRALAAASYPPIATSPNVIVQPMGVDVARFARLGRAPASPPTIVVAARLVPIKGVDVAIAALPHVRHDVRLVIAGDGPERPRLEQLVAHLDRLDPCARLRDRVRFLGTVDTPARDRLLREASLVVVPSRVLPNGRGEGMPTIALEALATGVPVIASALGGLASLDSATRVQPGDPIALATTIDRVLAAPPRADDLRASISRVDTKAVVARILDHALGTSAGKLGDAVENPPRCEAGDTSSRRTA